jgi:glycosyltransferase involved in cell wall biosynthesis
LRILLVTHTLPHDEAGGSQAYVQALATALAATNDVYVLSGSARGPTNLRVSTVRRLPALSADARAGTKAWWHLRDQWSMRQHLLMRRELERLAPDVVHTHQCQGLTSAVFSAIAAEGLPHVHTAHDLNLLCMNTRMNPGGVECSGRCAPCLLQRSIRSSLAARRLDFLIAPSEQFRRLHVSAGVVPDQRALTIHQGAEPGHAFERGGHQGPLRVGFIGALAEHKGVPTLLAAVETSRQSWTLEIAGDGPLAGRAAGAARANGRITYLGALAGVDKEAFFARVDVLAVPSEGQENAPLAISEASVRGIPTVASDRGGLAETQFATIVASRNPVALAAALDRLDADREEVRTRSRLLLERADMFSWQRHAEAVTSVLQRAQRVARLAAPALLPARRAATLGLRRGRPARHAR